MAPRASTGTLDANRASFRGSSEEHRPRRSWRAGSIAGIRMFVHATFLVLLAWVGISLLAQGHGLGGALAGVVLIVAVFAIVVLHELGHTYTKHDEAAWTGRCT